MESCTTGRGWAYPSGAGSMCLGSFPSSSPCVSLLTLSLNRRHLGKFSSVFISEGTQVCTWFVLLLADGFSTPLIPTGHYFSPHSGVVTVIPLVGHCASVSRSSLWCLQVHLEIILIYFFFFSPASVFLHLQIHVFQQFWNILSQLCSSIASAEF